MSFIKRENKRGPRTEPCGTPDAYSNCGTSAQSGVSFQIFLDNMQTVR